MRGVCVEHGMRRDEMSAKENECLVFPVANDASHQTIKPSTTNKQTTTAAAHRARPPTKWTIENLRTL